MVDQEKRSDRRVHARHLRDHQPGEKVAVTALGRRAQLQGCQPGKDVRRKLSLVPPVPCIGRNLGGQELAEFVQLPLFGGAQQGFVSEKVGGGQGVMAGAAHFGPIRMAPSSRMVSPLSMAFSTMCAARLAYSAGLPRRDGCGTCLPSDS